MSGSLALDRARVQAFQSGHHGGADVLVQTLRGDELDLRHVSTYWCLWVMWCYNGVGIQPVSLEDPIVATYLILCDYNTPRPGMLPFIFAVQKNLQLPVQVPMGFLTRPVTADQSCYRARNDEYSKYYKGSLHHTSVPLILPSISDTAIAVMNMPASMYVNSI